MEERIEEATIKEFSTNKSALILLHRLVSDYEPIQNIMVELQELASHGISNHSPDSNHMYYIMHNGLNIIIDPYILFNVTNTNLAYLAAFDIKVISKMVKEFTERGHTAPFTVTQFSTKFKRTTLKKLNLSEKQKLDFVSLLDTAEYIFYCLKEHENDYMSGFKKYEKFYINNILRKPAIDISPTTTRTIHNVVPQDQCYYKKILRYVPYNNTQIDARLIKKLEKIAKKFNKKSDQLEKKIKLVSVLGRCTYGSL